MEGKTLPHFLITNDDGVTAAGLSALAEALEPLGRITILAPDRNWSASGHAKTLHKPLRADPGVLPNGMPAIITSGCPSDAIALALMGLADKPVDMVIAGINKGPNLGNDLTYSGTVTAAMEGAIGGIPSIAISLDTWERVADYSAAAAFAARLARVVLSHGLPPDTFLNVNVPDLPAEQIKGVQITRMGLRIYRDALVQRTDPFGRPYYWIGGDPPTGIEETGTDIGALAQGYISVTPLQLDFTAYHLMKQLQTWEIDAHSDSEAQ